MKRKGTVPGKLTAKQLILVRQLCKGLSIEAAARAAKVGKTTVWRWMKDADFRKALTVAKGEIHDAAVIELKGAALSAARELVRLLKSENETTRRLTAVEILTTCFKLREVEDIDVRLRALERIVERNLGPRGILIPGESNHVS